MFVMTKMMLVAAPVNDRSPDWLKCLCDWQPETLYKIDDSTPVSQSRHTLRFQPIACRSIMRCPRVLTRPEMVWQAFVPDTANSQLAVFDIGQKKTQENGTVAMASVSQTNDTLSNVQVSHSSRFRSQKQG